jgi:hypothetical protein
MWPALLNKIDSAAVFVPDLTFVGARPDGRPMPNPNVLIEYGWALKSLTYRRFVAVMNTAFGEPTRENMPFDLGHFRHPITYHCPDDLRDTDKKVVRDKLAKDLEEAIRAILESDEFKNSLPTPPQPPPFTERPCSMYSNGRFKPSAEPIGITQDFRDGATELYLSKSPVCWFRMMPTSDPGRTWTADHLAHVSQNPFLVPLDHIGRG